MVKNIHQKIHGCAAVSYMYPEITEVDAANLFDFLLKSRTIKFNSLKKIKVRTIHP